MPDPSERFPDVPDLTHCLRQLLMQIPPGRVTTCGDLADALGNRIAARWVGHFVLHHQHDAACPCHRILRAGGELGPYIGDLSPFRQKARRLADEGVAVRQGVVDLDQFAFRDFISDRPLERLRRIQEDVQSRIVLRPRRRIPRFTGGVDVAYPSPDVGLAAYALVETATGRLVWSAAVRRPVAFPYISTYLSFREIPILLELLDEVRAAGRLADVLLVDGSGILHHRHAGIASHLGVAASLPTIGVTKKLLCGQVDIKAMAPGESRPVWERDQQTGAVSAKRPSGRSGKGSLAPFPPDETHLLGVALRPTAGSQRPIFISPGHRVDVTFAEQLVRALLCGHRLPEPIYWADRLSRKGVAS
jgi:deoxyribonuclease V